MTDENTLDEILRLAAAVGCAPEVVPDVVAARDRWARAPLVLVDEAALEAVGGLPRRSRVLLITRAAPGGDLWQRAFAAGIGQVVPLPEGEAVLAGALADLAEGPGSPGGCVIGVIGARGGAGASVLAAAIGLVAGDDALLLDCDPLGAGIDLMLGAESSDGARWSGLHLDGGRISMTTLDEALPGHRHRDGRLTFLSSDGEGPDAEAVGSVVDAGRRAGRVVVCDLSRHPSAATEAAVRRADLLVVVVPAELRACVSAQRLVRRLAPRSDCLRLVVRGPAPGGLNPQETAEKIGIPLLASMASERHLDRALECGNFLLRRRGPLAMAARTVLAAARPIAVEAAA
ncbi:septum site-determining protein Ssd [Amycolatopsis cynarae]|uniref:septum site-determining protein Ssd n=1 Tax=Amycolatopsis cynarae TaxID=2995223 RepID=UPI002E13254E